MFISLERSYSFNDAPPHKRIIVVQDTCFKDTKALLKGCVCDWVACPDNFQQLYHLYNDRDLNPRLALGTYCKWLKQRNGCNNLSNFYSFNSPSGELITLSRFQRYYEEN